MQYELNSGWKCKKSSEIAKTGEDISQPALQIKDWLPATVPGTVLTSLLNNKLIPDPFYGMNNKLIPDIYDKGRDYYTYWFVKDFKEKVPLPDDKFWLQFRGVNNSCDIYLNGHKINEATYKSMYLRLEFEVSKYLSKTGQNRLAVIVYPPDPVGNPNGGQGGDGVIAHNITNQFAAGWDWIQPIHDRNTGIWDKVFLKKTKQLRIDNTHIITSVPGKRIPTGSQKPASLKVTTDVYNPSDKDVLKAILECTIDGKSVKTTELEFQPQTTTTVAFDITIDNPRLWWPNGYGPQNLYPLNVVAKINDKVADEESLMVGIREMKTVWNTNTQSRELLVNGHRIFIKGGNRIAADEMMRFTPEKYNAEVRYHKDMNLNLIRVWGGGLTERPEFYDACDKYGIMVFQDFWVSGDCNGRWYDPMKLEDTNARRNYPDDHRLLVKTLEDQIKMLRNHPSLAYWCGGNEIRPPADVLKALRDTLLLTLDGTRYFFEFSNDDSMSLHGGDGPYTIQPDKFFWEHRSFPFNSEVGSIGVGDYASLEKFIPKNNMVAPFYDTVTKKWQIDSVWKYHKYIGYDSVIEAYGHPTDVKDFAKKAQLVNYNQYRALMEGSLARMWDWYTGNIIWKTQNPWTAMLGQMYDVYLDPNACLFGTAEACQPVHIMYDPVARSVKVSNTNYSTISKARMVVKAYKMDGEEVPVDAEYISIPADTCSEFYTLKKSFRVFSMDEGVFLYLGLNDSLDNLIDENLYWLPDETGNYSGLANMPKIPVKVEAHQINKGKVAISITNNYGSPIAFFNRISLIDAVSKQRILPCFYNNNYISVLPGQQETIIAEYTPTLGPLPKVMVEGWNVAEQVIDIK